MLGTADRPSHGTSEATYARKAGHEPQVTDVNELSQVVCHVLA